MYGVFAYIWLIFMVNVHKYTIHRWYRHFLPNKNLRKDGANESNDSDPIFPTSGTPAAPAASAPVSMVPAPVISRAGTYTPPHFETWLKFVADDLLLAKNFVKWGGL